MLLAFLLTCIAGARFVNGTTGDRGQTTEDDEGLGSEEGLALSRAFTALDEFTDDGAGDSRSSVWSSINSALRSVFASQPKGQIAETEDTEAWKLLVWTPYGQIMWRTTRKGGTSLFFPVFGEVTYFYSAIEREMLRGNGLWINARLYIDNKPAFESCWAHIDGNGNGASFSVLEVLLREAAIDCWVYADKAPKGFGEFKNTTRLLGLLLTAATNELANVRIAERQKSLGCIYGYEGT